MSHWTRSETQKVGPNLIQYQEINQKAKVTIASLTFENYPNFSGLKHNTNIKIQSDNWNNNYFLILLSLSGDIKALCTKMSRWSDSGWRANSAGPQTGGDAGLQPTTHWSMLSRWTSKLTSEHQVWWRWSLELRKKSAPWFLLNNWLPCRAKSDQTPEMKLKSDSSMKRKVLWITAWSPDPVSPVGDCVMGKTISPWRTSSCEETGVWELGSCSPWPPSVYQSLPLLCAWEDEMRAHVWLLGWGEPGSDMAWEGGGSGGQPGPQPGRAGQGWGTARECPRAGLMRAAGLMGSGCGWRHMVRLGGGGDIFSCTQCPDPILNTECL